MFENKFNLDTLSGVTEDIERDMALYFCGGSGGNEPGPDRFLFVWGEKEIPFWAEVSSLNEVDEDGSPLCDWHVFNMGRVRTATVHQIYEFSSQDEEDLIFGFIQEALKVFQYRYGRTKAKIREVKKTKSVYPG